MMLMRSSSLLLLLLLLATFSKVARANLDIDDDKELRPDRSSSIHLCSTPTLTQTEKDEMKDTTELWRSVHSYEDYLDDEPNTRNLLRGGKNRHRRHHRRLTSYTIDLHFVVFKNTTSHGGLKNHDRDAFLDWLDHGFAGTGFTFNYIQKYIVTNDTWHKCSDANNYKYHHRKGGTAEDLTVYFCDLINHHGLVAKATFPISYDATDRKDGIEIHNPQIASSLTDLEIYTTLIHEVGHWLGLLHTFEDGCTGSGDGVDDTAAQANPSWNNGGWQNCFVNKKTPQGTQSTGNKVDSCPSINDGSGVWKGLDRVNNYMNYIHEDCMANYSSFTDGQKDRMIAQWETYRLGN